MSWLSQYLDWFINERGDLEIHLDSDELRTELKTYCDLAWANNHPVPDPANPNNYRVKSYLELECEWLEPLICNDSYEWINPEEIGALTSAPILGVVNRDDDGKIQGVDSIHWYPNYQIRSPMDDLAETGKCIFTKGG